MNAMTAMDEGDRTLFRNTIERLAARYADIERWRREEIVCDDEEWQTFAEQGVFALGIAPQYGGLGGSVADLAMVSRELGYGLLPLPFVDTVVLAGSLIARLGDEATKQELLSAIVAGDLRIGFAHREADAGDRPDYVETRFENRRISGEKIHVMDGVHAGKFLVSARGEAGELRMLLVDRHSEGIAIQPYRLVDNRMACKIVFDRVEAAPIGGEASGALADALNLGVACSAAETVGAIAGLNRDTREYAKVRRQFGRSIGSFQVIQHKLVDMFIAEHMAMAMLEDALVAVEAGGKDSQLRLSAAKAQSDRSGRMVAENSIQIHGGMGLTDECSAGHYLKRILTTGTQFGTVAWHVATIARHAI